MIHTVKGFSVVNEAELDVFLEFFCFLYDVGNLISGSSTFSKSTLNTKKFSHQEILNNVKQHIKYRKSSKVKTKNTVTISDINR